MAITHRTRRLCRRVLLGTALPIAVVALASPGSKETQPYGIIAGTVYGPGSRPVYGAKVKIRRADEQKARWELYSDHHGEFAQRVPVTAADYVVWVELKGKKGAPLQPEVKVHIDGEIHQDISLHLSH